LGAAGTASIITGRKSFISGLFPWQLSLTGIGTYNKPVGINKLAPLENQTNFNWIH
jgi:hypothetical protein